MTDNETNHNFDMPPAQPAEEPVHHHFDAEVPNAPNVQNASKKKVKHGSFSTGFTPRRETPSVSPKSANASNPVSNAVPETAPEFRATSNGNTNTYTSSPSPFSPAKTWSPVTAIDRTFEWQRLIVLFAVLIPLSLFAYLPALYETVNAWYINVDYSHGFLVVPLAALFLFLRIDTYPGTHYRLTWIGLFPIIVCCLMRVCAAQWRMDALEQWSILPWILGIVWFFYGSRVFLWALPSLMFLMFMFQLPWSFDVLLKHHLQAIATQFAAVLLNILGEAAVPIKNTIRLSTTELSVEQACSGIRFLISIFAISYATVLLIKRPWWQNVLILVIAFPIALFVNAARIAMTGILLLHFKDFITGMTPKNGNPAVIADEISGIFMIFVALGIFAAFVFYLGKVFRRVEI